MKKRLAYKDPSAILFYQLEWDLSSAIASSTWSVEPVETGGLQVQSALVSGAKTIALISGGIENRIYTAINTVTTQAGERDRRYIQIKIQKRYDTEYHLSYLFASSETPTAGGSPTVPPIISTVRTPLTISATGPGTIPEGAQSVTIANTGDGAGTVLGEPLPAGTSASWSVVGGSDVLGLIPYDATGTTFLIFTVR